MKKKICLVRGLRFVHVPQLLRTQQRRTAPAATKEGKMKGGVVRRAGNGKIPPNPLGLGSLAAGIAGQVCLAVLAVCAVRANRAKRAAPAA